MRRAACTPKLPIGKIVQLLAPNYYSNLADSRPIFDWMQIIRQAMNGGNTAVALGFTPLFLINV